MRRLGEAIAAIEHSANSSARIVQKINEIAKAASKADWTALAGRNVTIWPDHDKEGVGYAADVARLAREAGVEIELVNGGGTGSLAFTAGDPTVTEITVGSGFLAHGIVCCSLSGFGMTGPRSAQPGYDYILQGLAGWMDVTGEPDGPPTKSGLSMVDFSGGAPGLPQAAVEVHEARGDHEALAFEDAGPRLLGLEQPRVRDLHRRHVREQREDLARERLLDRSTQRLHALDLTGVQAHDRLVVDDELVLGAVAQPVGDVHPPPGGVAQVWPPRLPAGGS